jgi:hypothetical protein
MDLVVSLSLLSISLVAVYYSGRSDEADAALDKALFPRAAASRDPSALRCLPSTLRRPQ